MTLNNTLIYLVTFLVILIIATKIISWYQTPTRLNSMSPYKLNKLIKLLKVLALFFIWLIGLSIGFMVIGFIVNWHTVDTFLWEKFEIILVISLGMLFLISLAIVHIKKQGGDVGECFSELVNHLYIQMTFIVAITLIYGVTLIGE